MKPYCLLLVAAALFALPACEQRTNSEKVENAVDDALDRRPGEKVRDAAENARDAIKEAGSDVKDAAKDATN
jgi:hypothetical protein